ncbi:hypothetical protein GGR05_004370 [Aureimonas phyllosphaerae]|uniref:Uncharacterized protein n=1 Tax=Aureimonas phyllosphaerae TaxID=1166078 RepID=A0A7W6BY32_9HYPH|nr:hypothetical protein [Aureimonas phyllosphaerae]MBB3938199.1 hypothetical protein [Aureimonas phyllosphaerae]
MIALIVTAPFASRPTEATISRVEAYVADDEFTASQFSPDIVAVPAMARSCC